MEVETNSQPVELFDEIVVPYTFFEDDRETYRISIDGNGEHVSTTFVLYQGEKKTGEITVLHAWS